MRNIFGKLMLATAAVVAIPGAASAAIVIGSITPGTPVYSGPAPTYDFDATTPTYSGGLVTSTSVSGVSAQPYGSTGKFWTVGPTDGSPGTLDLSSFGDINNISFIWGSVDAFNKIEFLDAGNNVLAFFTGTDIVNPADGSQTDPIKNPVVKFNVTGTDVGTLSKVRLSSTSNAFETDNYAVNSAVPEPSTWGMMLLGFGLLGGAMRRRKAGTVRGNFNFA